MSRTQQDVLKRRGVWSSLGFGVLAHRLEGAEAHLVARDGERDDGGRDPALGVDCWFCCW